MRGVRAQIASNGPERTRPFERDFERVAVPSTDCDVLRDLLVADQARTVIEIGLAYANSSLAIGEALLTIGGTVSHIVIDPHQASAFRNAGWEAMLAAGLNEHTMLLADPSSIVLPRLWSEGVVADAAFVDGSHRFHEVFVDLYFLRKLIRPAGLVVLDDARWPSVATALRYYDRYLGWTPVDARGRLVARRLPKEPIEPAFDEFRGL